MLLKQETLREIEKGYITVAFRRWRRPTVKAGGTLLTSVGQLSIEAVDIVNLNEITESEAIAAGFANLALLLSQLLKHAQGDVYRVRLSLAGPDPRIALRREIPGSAELELILKRLRHMDGRSASGPWTKRVLKLIYERPGKRAADLATEFGADKPDFKAKVRRLKGLGLTESLKVGYRLSPRGLAVLEQLRPHSEGS